MLEPDILGLSTFNIAAVFFFCHFETNRQPYEPPLEAAITFVQAWQTLCGAESGPGIMLLISYL